MTAQPDLDRHRTDRSTLTEAGHPGGGVRGAGVVLVKQGGEQAATNGFKLS